MARKFDDVVATTKKSAGKNTAEGLVLHHTGGGTYKSNLAYLSTNPAQASVHFVLGENGELGKIGDPADRLRHAGASEWRGRTNCNNFLLGIEIVGVGQPNAKQFTKLTEFCKYLIGAFGRKSTDCFPRHAEIATPKGRKADISLDFFGGQAQFDAWKNSLFAPSEPKKDNTDEIIRTKRVIQETQSVINAINSLTGFTKTDYSAELAKFKANLKNAQDYLSTIQS